MGYESRRNADVSRTFVKMTHTFAHTLRGVVSYDAAEIIGAIGRS
jgi:hypothetical protein